MESSNCQDGGNHKFLCHNNDCIACFNRSFKSSDKDKFWSKKNKIDPRFVCKNSNKKYIFDCDVCNHEFINGLNKITSSGRWCQFCSNKALCSNNACVHCYNNSFASSDKAKYWSNKNVKRPRDVFKSSHVIYIFDCNDCNHEFTANLNNVTEGKWCNFCANCSLCCDNNCLQCYNNSFASSNNTKYQWSNKNTVKPRDVFKSSNNAYIFDCDKCGHEFTCKLDEITSGKSGCGFCGKKQLCTDDKCTFCFNNSFLSCDKAKFWSKKNIEKPRDLFKGSNKKTYIFDCHLCNNEYITTLNAVSKGTWCACVVNKTETKLHNWLKENKYQIQIQKKFEWCKNPETNKYLPFDFVIENYKIIIELDGTQHFEQIFVWQAPEKIQKRDVYKMIKALENRYSIIRLLQTDVFSDKNDWNKKLLQSIKQYIIPQCIYLDNNNEYSTHMKMMNEKNNIKFDELVDDYTENLWNDKIIDNNSSNCNSNNSEIERDESKISDSKNIETSEIKHKPEKIKKTRFITVKGKKKV